MLTFRLVSWLVALSTFIAVPMNPSSASTDGRSGVSFGWVGDGRDVRVEAGYEHTSPASNGSGPSNGLPGAPVNHEVEHTCFYPNGSTRPCKGPTDDWSPELGCFIQYMQPQPPQTDPVWAGRTSGAIYRCWRGAPELGEAVWRPSPPDTGPPPVVVAEEAIRQLRLQPIVIGKTPRDGGIGILSVPTWLWVETPSMQQYAPNTEPRSATATAGPVSVTADAHVTHISYDMGDGHTVTCQTSGTPYRTRFGDRASPDCGHIYLRSSTREPQRSYEIRATAHWQVDWHENTGPQTGQRILTLTSTTRHRVAEIQLLTGP